MKIIEPSVRLINAPSREELYKKIEEAGRTCYKSGDRITPDSTEKFIARILKNGHESVLEHGSITAVFVCDRGVSHEIVRHRIASYSQESTRFCNYSQEKFGNEITVIEPLFWSSDSEQYQLWFKCMKYTEAMYLQLLHAGASPQEARSVLPNSLKTEIVITMNIREWRHFFNLRVFGKAGKPHPQMKQVAGMAYELFKENWPVLFTDLEE